MNNNDKKPEENITKYGEFVCSFHQWLPIEIQKKQTEKMSKMTKQHNSKK